MATPNFPSNSNHSKKEPENTPPARPKIGKVVDHEVTQQVTLGSKFKMAFFGDDIKDVGSHVFWEVIIPFAKNTIVDVINEATNRTFYGSSGNVRSRSTSGGGRSASYVSYGRMAAGGRENRPGPNGPAAQAAAQYVNRDDDSFNNLVFDTRGDAENVLETLRDYLEKYGAVRRSDLLDSVGHTGSFVDEKWGWFDLTRAAVTRARSGKFLLDLPDAVEIH